MKSIELSNKCQPDNCNPQREGESIEEALDADSRLIFSAEKCSDLRHDEARNQRTDQQTDAVESGWMNKVVGKQENARDTCDETEHQISHG